MKNSVKKYRLLSDITQSNLADLLGVSRQTIHAIESAKYVPSTVLALKLSKFLKADINELFTLEKED